MRSRLLLLIQIIIVACLVSCKKDFDFNKVRTPTWEPDLAIPLVNDSITFESGLEASGSEKNFIIDESGDVSILFYYNNDAFKIKPADLLKFSSYPFAFSHLFTLAEQQIIEVQDFTIPGQNFTINLSNDLPGGRIDKILLKQGSIIVNYDNTFSNPGNLTLDFPQGTKNGQPFSAVLNVITQGQNTQSIDLSGVLFNFTANPGKMDIILGGIIKKSSRPIAGDNLGIVFNLKIETVARFEGFLGQKTIQMEEEFVKITVFNNAFALGTLYFQNPSVSVEIINSIGVPARVTIEELKSTNFASGVSVDITNQLGSNKIFNVPSPLLNDILPAKKYMEYTNSNTNNSINPFINIKPNRVYYKIKTEINPDNTGINFFRDTSSFYADVRVKMPLYGYFDKLTIQDTFDFNLYKQKNVDYALLRTAITNGLPLMARMQVYFTDENYNKIDSLVEGDNILIREASVDPATALPYIGQYGIKDTSFMLDHARILKLESARKILVKAVLNSSGGGNQMVRIKADQVLKLNFSALVKISEKLGQ